MFLLHFLLMRTFVFALHLHLKIQNAYIPGTCPEPLNHRSKTVGGWLCNPLFILQNGVRAPSVYKMQWQRVHNPITNLP